MWYKKVLDHTNLINPIAEIRPMLKEHYESKGRIIGAAAYSMLHHHFVISLKQISPATKFPKKPNNLRVMESDAAGPIAIHAVSLDNNNPELLTTFLGQKYIANFQAAISKIKTKAKDETKGEIRSISLPALNVEAVWLNRKSKPDIFAMVWEFSNKDKELFTRNQFLSRLKQLKNKQDDIKDEMGA